MKKGILLLVAALSMNGSSEPSCLDNADKFFSWLNANKAKFAACELNVDQDQVVLCDGTTIEGSELKKMFRMKPKDLLEFIGAKKVKVEVLCDQKEQKGHFHECLHQSHRKMFQKVTSLHGMHLPQERLILIRSSTTPGSLIHEWIHFLQSSNTSPIYGRIYKKERVAIQDCLTKIMDDQIALITELEKSGDIKALKASMQTFMEAQQRMMQFSLWQDLIDERSIFVLFLKLGKAQGVSEEDLLLARKNMQYICLREELKKDINPLHCKF